LVAKLYATGSLRGSIEILYGLASVRGTLSLTGTLGGGLTYVNVPSSKLDPVFGGDLNINGELRASALFWDIARIGPRTLYQTSFGDLPGKAVHLGEKSFLRPVTVLIDNAYSIPDYAPQPSMDARESDIGVVWIDATSGQTSLLFSDLKTASPGFSSPVLVARNEHSIATPQASLMPNGSALIGWAQNRYTSSTVPANAKLENLIAAQDIYVALLDANSSSVQETIAMEDDTTGFESGRAEAEPRICAIDNSRGVVAWLARSSNRTGTDIWFATLTRNGSALSTSHPQMIPDLAGVNKHLTLTRVGNDAVMAIWINDPDGLDSTYNDRILYSIWKGSDWTAPAVLTTTAEGQSLDGINLAMSDQFGVLTWTSTERDTTGRFLSEVNAQIWNRSSGQWLNGTRYEANDSLSYFQNPTVTISPSDKVTISYQVVPRVSDSTNNDQGRRYLLLRDLNNPSSTWKEVPGLEFLSDTTSFVWDAKTAFGENDILYALTEEKSSNAPVKNGVPFGNPKLGLILRSVRLNSDLSIQDVDEPQTPAGISEQTEAVLAMRLELNPNPVTDQMTLSYSLSHPAHVKIELFDLLGNRLGILIDQLLEAGNYQTRATMGEVGNGFYLCRMSVDGIIMSRPFRIIR
jgi:hypothetical protein